MSAERTASNDTEAERLRLPTPLGGEVVGPRCPRCAGSLGSFVHDRRATCRTGSGALWKDPNLSDNAPPYVGLTIHPASQSLFLRALVSAVRSGRVNRGYGWLLQALPTVCWGGQVVLSETTLGNMAVPLTDPSGFSLIFSGSLRNEASESKLIGRLAAQCRTFVDVGAHYGWYARLVSRNNPRCRVVAIEPDPFSVEVLRYNVSEHAHATVIEAAVGSGEGFVTLWRASSRDLSSTVRRTGEPLRVALTTLDRTCSELRIDSVDLVKCDVEGGEADVLRGAHSLIRSDNPPIWMFEVYEDFAREAGVHIQEDIVDVFRASDRHGSFFSSTEDGTVKEIRVMSERKRNNVMWVPRSRRQQFLDAVNA